MSVRSKQGRARYNPDWENPTLFPDTAEWIKSLNTGKPSDDVHYFQCRVCNNGRMSLSNMDVGAPKEQMTDPPNGKKCKHNLKMDSLKGIRQDCFQQSKPSSSPSSANTSSFAQISTSLLTQASSSSQSSTFQEISVAKPCNGTQSRLDNSPPEVIKSLILWAFNVVNNHYSLRSAGSNGELFQEMFPDSEIAKEFALSAGKLRYIIHHGLAPYFKMRIMEELSKASKTPSKIYIMFR